MVLEKICIENEVAAHLLHIKFPHLHNVSHVAQMSHYKCLMWLKRHILSVTSVVSVAPKFLQVS
jgi:hypothetical protein